MIHITTGLKIHKKRVALKSRDGSEHMLARRLLGAQSFWRCSCSGFVVRAHALLARAWAWCWKSTRRASRHHRMVLNGENNSTKRRKNFKIHSSQHSTLGEFEKRLCYCFCLKFSGSRTPCSWHKFTKKFQERKFGYKNLDSRYEISKMYTNFFGEFWIQKIWVYYIRDAWKARSCSLKART